MFLKASISDKVLGVAERKIVNKSNARYGNLHIWLDLSLEHFLFANHLLKQ